jgi:type II secretory pathway pseudopilin PulG
MEDSATACPGCGRPVGPPAVPANPEKKRSGGPLLAIVLGCGCLAVIAVAGIIAAILIPNFLDAMQKSRQKRTMGDLRQVGLALVSYATDSETLTYPQVGRVEELAPLLVPEHLAAMPAGDGWGHPIRYACWQEDPASAGCDTFRLASPGRDGRLEHEDLRGYSQEAFAPTDYDRDLVFELSGFVQYPAAASR